MTKIIAMALMVTSLTVVGDEVKELKTEEPVKTVVTMPVEGMREFTAEQMKEILEKDKARVERIQEQVEKAKEAKE